MTTSAQTWARQVWAVLQKEFRLDWRFPTNYLGTFLIDPFITFLFVVILYAGFFRFGGEQIATVNRQNFISFLLLGTIANLLFYQGLVAFQGRLISEKFWGTVQGMLISPLRRTALLFGMGLHQLIVNMLAVVLLLSFALFLNPVPLGVVFGTVSLFLGIFLTTLAIGLLIGAISLVNENFLLFTRYGTKLWALLSCFFYPKDILPEFLHPIVNINPIYFGVTTIRALWFEHRLPPHAELTLPLFLFFIAFVLLFSTGLFRQLWRRYGIAGY